MHFAYPYLVWLSILALAGAGLAVWALWRKRQAMRRLSALGQTGPLLLVNRKVQVIKTGLLAAAAILLGIVLLGPQWGRTAEPTEPAKGRDVLVILDVSNSMLGEDMVPDRLSRGQGVDVPPSRLNAAKDDIRRLAAVLEQEGGYRIGLIGFADRAVVLCPLTFDYRCFEDELTQASLAGIRIRGRSTGDAGTDIACGLRRAEQVIDKQATAYTDVLLFSDGGDLESGALAAADRLAAAGVAVHTVGVGDAQVEAPIPVKQASGLRTFLKDDEGQVVRTRLEEDVLRQIAQRTKGHYFAVGTGLLDLDSVCKELLAAKPTRELKKGGQGFTFIHRFQWFLAPALALLLLEMLWRDGRRRGAMTGREFHYFPWRRRKRQPLAEQPSSADAGRS
jgi:Ca-activated chloride channel family protein